MSARAVAEQIARLDAIGKTRALTDLESSQLQRLITVESRYAYMKRANDAARLRQAAK